ncbi:MAG TPA: polysaccharide deacetylase family protein [Polyangia bacterium]|nr:polysaccharide deacetylase family protein [Polyangia bacterium]
MLKLHRDSRCAFFSAALLFAACGGTGNGAGAGSGGQTTNTDGGSGGNGNGGNGGNASGSGGSQGNGGAGSGGATATGTGGAVGMGGMTGLIPPVNGAIPSTITTCAAAADAGAFTFSSIPVWRDDATAGYVMIHDDMCGDTLRGIDKYAVPAMTARGINSGLGPYVEACQTTNIWNVVQDAESKGNEIVNHSYTHVNITAANSAHEVVDAKTLFDTKVMHKLSFFIFPYDFFTDETIAAVSTAGHLGARAGLRDPYDGFENLPMNPAALVPAGMIGNDLQLVFDVWPRTYSKYALYHPEDVLDIHVWNAIDAWDNPPTSTTATIVKQKVFAVREMHSVSMSDNPPEDGSEGFGPVPLSVYQKHLDFLVAAWKANKVWTTTPTSAIKYRHARTACTASVTGSMLTFNTSNADCTKYATPISVIVTTAKDVPGVSALQGGKEVATRKLMANTFSVTADPTLGPVTLDGCTTPSEAVDTTAFASYKKPTPANSVCDLEQVKGKGSPGLMDNLERSLTDSLVTFPNPAQGDGRDGAWSWYPGTATVEIVKDATANSNVLHFTGKNLAAYAGATLAFLGGNGGGACYDSTAYKGVRFKIKGHDTATDVYNGKIYLSLITAETQSRKYGGDHVGDCGHFHVPVTVTADWQTVSVNWTDFMAPTFGTAPVPTTLAMTKMQALDFGVSSATSDFEIFLDDIELF